MNMKIKMVTVCFVALLSFYHFPANEGRSIPDGIFAAGGNNNELSDDKSFFSEAPHFKNWIHCPKPLDRNDESSSCDASAVHVAMTIDCEYMRGTIASVHSILTHASCPESLFFHFVASDSSDSRSYARTLESTFPSLSFKLYVFKDSIVADLISSSIREALDTPLNYARSYLADLLGDCVKRVIYLDSDTLVVDDIAKLWRVRLTGSTSVAAPEYCQADFEKYFTGEFWSDGELRRVFAGRKKPCYFNTGVMVMDLARWRERGFTAEIERWMKVQKERKRIYELGSLPPFLLVFAGDIEAIDHRWNQHGLGGDNVVNSCRSLHPGPVSLLHWSGKGKPWVRLHSGQPCPVDFLWAPYDLYNTMIF